jgi:alpha-1,6-mannosyltransferase
VSLRRLSALVGCGLALLALTGAGLLAQRRHETNAFLAVALAQGAVYLAALALLRRSPASRRDVALVLGIAAAMRVAVAVTPPYLSTDVYRYVWDGRVIAAGINPYRYIPADPHLAALRDPAIFPNINRRNYAHTIYPPAAEVIFFAVTRLGAGVTAMKAAMVGFEAIAVALLLRLLVLSGQPPSRIAIYAWHPLPLWEFAGSGHIDAAIVALVALALWCRRRASGWPTGLALVGGTLVKFYPAAIFPSLWQRWDWRMPAVFCLTMIAAYLPFIGVGWGVFGFLPHYMGEEGFAGGGAGLYLWDIAKAILPLRGIADATYLAGAAALGSALAGFVALRRHGPDADVRGAALLAGAFMLLLSPHYPWYFAWLLVFACLAPSAALVWLTLASFLLYLVPVWPQLMRSRPWLLVQSILYVPFLALAAAEGWRRHQREQAKHGERLSR